jgi:hypothetical protein
MPERMRSMSRRRGELTLRQVRRDWPFAVVVPREVFDTPIQLDRAYPSMAPRLESVRIDGRDWIKVYFADAEQAETFRSRANIGQAG